jgi:hypothetical protein
MLRTPKLRRVNITKKFSFKGFYHRGDEVLSGTASKPLKTAISKAPMGRR